MCEIAFTALKLEVSRGRVKLYLEYQKIVTDYKCTCVDSLKFI